jgi:hypothetical protein
LVVDCITQAVGNRQSDVVGSLPDFGVINVIQDCVIGNVVRSSKCITICRESKNRAGSAVGNDAERLSDKRRRTTIAADCEDRDGGREITRIGYAERDIGDLNRGIVDRNQRIKQSDAWHVRKCRAAVTRITNRVLAEDRCEVVGELIWEILNAIAAWD